MLQVIEKWIKNSWSRTGSLVAAIMLVPVEIVRTSITQTLYHIFNVKMPKDDFPIYLKYALPFANMRYTQHNWMLLMFRDVTMEEIYFRLIPVVIAQRLGLSVAPLLLLGIADSMFFGWYHGGWYYVGLQGVGGFAYFLFFLKSGAAKKKYGWAFLMVLLTHYLWDLYLQLRLQNAGFGFGE